MAPCSSIPAGVVLAKPPPMLKSVRKKDFREKQTRESKLDINLINSIFSILQILGRPIKFMILLVLKYKFLKNWGALTPCSSVPAGVVLAKPPPMLKSIRKKDFREKQIGE